MNNYVDIVANLLDGDFFVADDGFFYIKLSDRSIFYVHIESLVMIGIDPRYKNTNMKYSHLLKNGKFAVCLNQYHAGNIYWFKNTEEVEFIKNSKLQSEGLLNKNDEKENVEWNHKKSNNWLWRMIFQRKT